MNAAVRAVTRAALARGAEVFGVRNGYAGLLADTMEPLRARDVGGIVQRGGTVLGSARCPEFAEPSGRIAARRNPAPRVIYGRVVIGGYGSQTGSATLAREGFAVVGVPSTIDNDVYGTDVSIGADTAVNITLEAIDRLRTTASSHSRAFAVETMGRDCGYIALMAGIAGGAEVIALPESEIAPAEECGLISRSAALGRSNVMRLSLRFIVPLGIALTAIAYAVVPLVDRLTLQWFVRDLEIRSTTIANAAQEPLTALVREPRARQKVLRYFERIIQDERIFAIGFCDPAGKMLYATSTFPERVRCPQAGEAGGQSRLGQVERGPVH